MLAHAGRTALASSPPRPRLASFVPACAASQFRPALAAPHPFGCPPARPPRAQRVTQRPQPGRAAMTVKYLASRHSCTMARARATARRHTAADRATALWRRTRHRGTGRDGGTGRRSGLKIRRGQPRGGSTPPPGTKAPPKRSALPYVAGDRARGQRRRRLSRARANPYVALHRSRVADDQHMPVRRRAERDIRQTVFARARSGPA